LAYHDDLLLLSFELIDKDLTSLRQADLRRSVSTAYYAVFHLLISETVAHWSLDSSRDALARTFDHSLMRKVSKRVPDPRQYPFPGQAPAVVVSLRHLAQSFVQLQDKRHTADYDNATL
jgi:hypothetical protein